MYMNATKSTDLVCNKLPLKQFTLHRLYHPAREVDRQPFYPALPLARPGAIRHYLSSPLQRNPSRCWHKKFQLHQQLRHLQERIISLEHGLTINADLNATASAQNRNKLHLEQFTQNLPPAWKSTQSTFFQATQYYRFLCNEILPVIGKKKTENNKSKTNRIIQHGLLLRNFSRSCSSLSDRAYFTRLDGTRDDQCARAHTDTHTHLNATADDDDDDLQSESLSLRFLLLFLSPRKSPFTKICTRSVI